MLEKVIENWTSRLDYIRASHDSPMPEIIFKILTTSASTIEPPIIPNTLTFKSVGFPPRSAIVRVSVINSGIPPIFLPIPVWELIIRALGWSTRRVAGQVNRSECAVRNCWEQWTREGTHARKTGSGATRKTTRREDRRIVRQALVDPTVTRSTIRADVGVAIVPQTISRHLAEANLKSKRPFCALPLTPEHRQLRLQWYQGRSMWNVTDRAKGCV
ncbi:HTH_Tnp_Tc3_2 domain-containing protein [Trichonephila clavipes]|nr:HTH_Tnp_Tc3_2 domain-containing protein [Trichonephila clavipes]